MSTHQGWVSLANQYAKWAAKLGERISGGPVSVRCEWEDEQWWASVVYANGESSPEEQGDEDTVALFRLVRALEKMRDDMHDEIAGRDTERAKAAIVDVEIDERHIQ